MPKGVPLKRYTGEFKQKAIEDMYSNGLSQNETATKYQISKSMIQRWDRKYHEEGPESLYRDQRGRTSIADGTRKRQPPKLGKKAEEDLIAENQRLRAEVDYLKKLNALVSERVQRENSE